MNEVLLGVSLGLIYGSVIVGYALFGRWALIVWGSLAPVLANIEVAVLLEAFGLVQTLGNVLFASTFLVTDTLSEIEGKKTAKKAVGISVFCSVFFLLLVQLWLHYVPMDGAIGESFERIFAQTPRLVFVSLAVFVIAMYVDVWLYHWWWNLSTKILGSKERWLWLRNNGSTLISQLINATLFNVGAFYGVYDGAVILEIIISSYLIFILLALLDTPVLYGLVYLFKRKKKYDSMRI